MDPNCVSSSYNKLTVPAQVAKAFTNICGKDFEDFLFTYFNSFLLTDKNIRPKFVFEEWDWIPRENQVEHLYLKSTEKGCKFLQEGL